LPLNVPKFFSNFADSLSNLELGIPSHVRIFGKFSSKLIKKKSKHLTEVFPAGKIK